MRRLTDRKRYSLLLIVVLIATSFTTMGTPARADSLAAASESDRAAPAQHLLGSPGGAVSPEGLLNPDGTLDLSAGFQGTMDLQGWDVTLDGERGPVLSRAFSPDTPPASFWNALPNQGVNNQVGALAVVGSDLYVGGLLSQTGDGTVTGLGYIARYDTAAGTWHALPNQGVSGPVFALAVVGSDLYVGGIISYTGDGSLTDLGNIARYDTAAGTWHALPNQGLDYTVDTLAVVGDDLYVGGGFDATGDGTLTNLGNIARYDTAAGTWHALPNQGLDSTVWGMTVVGSDLYVGGRFDATGDGTVANLGNIARYDTTVDTWHTLSNNGLSRDVHALAVVGDDLYVSGNFSQTVDGTVTDLGHIARYDMTAGTWQALPNQGLDDAVGALVLVGSDLYVGGSFSQTGDGTLTNLGFIARYDTSADAWHPLPNQGLASALPFSVDALAVLGGDLYVGGFFFQTGDGTLTDLGNIARYGSCPGPICWRRLPNLGVNDDVRTLAVLGSDLYVGGEFATTGDGSLTDLGNIARYDTTAGTWHALPNQGVDGRVRALAVVGGDLYVGGFFSQTGDGSLTDLGNIARYDTAAGTWHALPNQGLDSRVRALAVVGSDLYVGGFFTQTGDGLLTGLGAIARYDTAAGTWHALANQGLGGWVYALAVVGSDLYVGGELYQTGDGSLTELWYIARYDTAAGTWHALANQGLNGAVHALAVVGSDLYVGGDFVRTWDGSLTELGHIARYDTVAGTWQALPNQGLDSQVRALAVVGSDLYVGGYFGQTGDGSLTELGHVARYDTTTGSWHALPNQGLNGWVLALTVVGSDLYAGGIFDQTGDGWLTDLGNIARLPVRSTIFLPLVVRHS